MDLEGQKTRIGQKSLLFGFINDLFHVLGTIELPDIFGISPRQVQVNVKFFVVQVNYTLNVILG